MCGKAVKKIFLPELAELRTNTRRPAFTMSGRTPIPAI